MADYDSNWNNETARPAKLNVVSLFSVASEANLPTSGFEQHAKCMAEDTGAIYINNGNATTCSWVKKSGSIPADSQFAPSTKSIDGSTAIAVSDSEFTTPTTMTASSNGILTDSTLHSQTQTDATNEQIRAGANTRAGQEINTSHSLIGKTVRKVTWRVRRVGTLTGNVECKVRDSSDVVKATLGTYLASSISTSIETITIGDGSTSAVIAAGDRLTFEYSGGDGSNYIEVYYKNSDVDGNSNWSLYNGSWSDAPTADFYFVAIGDATSAVTSMKDDKSNPTTLRHKTNSEVGAWVKADMGSAVEMLGVAVHFHADTDITSFKIETSADDSTYIRRKTVPYTLITEGAWNIILFPRPPLACRYLKITALDAGAKVISVNEIAVFVLTDSVINRRGYPVDYTPTTSCLTLLGA